MSTAILKRFGSALAGISTSLLVTLKSPWDGVEGLSDHRRTGVGLVRALAHLKLPSRDQKIYVL